MNNNTYNRFQVALDIQNAGNLRAIAREFVRVVDDAMAETQSTTATWDDAAVVLMVNKLESLCRSEAVSQPRIPWRKSAQNWRGDLCSRSKRQPTTRRSTATCRASWR